MGEGLQPGTEAFRSVKDEINQEGWEQDDDGEGQAAVFIGTKEDAKAARLRLESKEPTFADLRSYMAVNSVKMAEAHEVEESYKGTVALETWKELKPGSCNFSDRGGRLLYKSKDGSLKECKIDYGRISDLAVLPLEQQIKAFYKSIHEMGFGENTFVTFTERVVMDNRRSNLKKEKATKEFEF